MLRFISEDIICVYIRTIDKMSALSLKLQVSQRDPMLPRKMYFVYSRWGIVWLQEMQFLTLLHSPGLEDCFHVVEVLE